MVKDLFSLEGKVAIVTGGSRGIGKAIAKGFAEAGADIVIAARSEAEIKKTVKEIESGSGRRVIGVKADVIEEEQILAMVARTMKEFGRVNILVNVAGVATVKAPQDFTIREWDDIININLRSVFLCSRLVYHEMKKAGGGKIINIGSLMSVLGSGGSAPYGASKGGVLQLSRSLAVAWAKDNIQVNAILPGWISTDLTARSCQQFPDMYQSIINHTPAARWGEPQDLIGAAVFLASHASDFVTGIALPVDGGYLCGTM